MSDVFISHVEEDADTVLDIVRGLEAAGYTTWSFERDSYPGLGYLDQVERAIEGCNAVIVLISPESLGSQQVEDEVTWARDQRKHFLPVLKGISWAEFQTRRPKWRMALGIATAVSIPLEGVGVILPRILRGLEALGVQPSAPHTQQQQHVAEPPKSQKQLSPEEFVEEAKRLQQAGDYAEAFRLFKEAATGGNREAMTCVGRLYENGQGVAQDYAEARQWYERAAAAGSADAMFNLGLLYGEGKSVAQDHAKALHWYEKAAAAGSSAAAYKLRKASEPLAAGGNAEAMNRLGVLYANGQVCVAARVFISHSNADRAFVETEILPLLRGNGIEAWYSPSDIRSANEWMNCVLVGLDSCDWFLVVMTPSAVSSEWVQAEVLWAMENKRRVVPVMLESCNPAALHLKLLRIQYVDFRHDRQVARRRLLETWDITQLGSNIADEVADVPIAERVGLSWNVFEHIIRTPRQFHGKLLEVSAILPDDVHDLDEMTRRALGLSTKFRQRSVIEAFIEFDNNGVFTRIPNKDYHANVLLSDPLLRTLGDKLYKGSQWDSKTFHYRDISDEDALTRFALRLEARFVGYVKVHRTSLGKKPGLFADLVRVV